MTPTLQGQLGIDFGTSNSAVAWADDQGLARLIPLEGQALAMPTAVFYNAEEAPMVSRHSERGKTSSSRSSASGLLPAKMSA